MKKKTTPEETRDEEAVEQTTEQMAVETADATLDEVKKLSDELSAAKEEVNRLNDALLRTAAEYDNFRRRTAKEREQLFADAYAEAVSAIIPTLDNLERALSFGDDNPQALKDGLVLTVKQFKESFNTLGVEEIPTDIEFNPELHNAVMHIDDETITDNTIVEVFQKGYKIGEKVIRHSLVKVAN